MVKLTDKLQSQIGNKLIAISKMLAWSAILVGILVLIGWQWNLDVIKRVSKTAVAMNPLTAICFILTGIILWIINKGEDYKRKTIAQLLSFLVLIIGLLEFS